MNRAKVLTSRFGSAVQSVALILVFSGCVQKPALVVEPVKGRVLLDDQPLTKGVVIFSPDTGDPKSVAASGGIDKDGQFELQLSAAGPLQHVPVGRYKVTVFYGRPGMVSKEAPFDPKYSSAEQTPLLVEVSENAAPGAYDIKLTKN